MATATNTSDRELVITRLLNAPRELVFQVFTDPQHVAHWWGPNGFTNTIHEMNVVPDGLWRLTMHGPDGVDYPNKIKFIKVVKPELLVYTHGSDDEKDPLQFETTIIFVAKGQQTELTMKGVFKSKEDLEFVVKNYHAKEGQVQTITRLEEYLAGLK